MNAAVTSSKDLESLRDSSDFPVHNKPCLWKKVEKLEVIFQNDIRNRTTIRLRLDVNPVYSFAQSRQQFIGNRSGHLRNLLGS